MHRRHLPLVAVGACWVFSLTSGAWATEPLAQREPAAVALARLLAPRASATTLPRRHALADESGRIPVTVVLPPGVDARARGLLPVAPGFAAIRVAPDRLGQLAAAQPDLGLWVAPPRKPLLDVSQNWTGSTAFSLATEQRGEGVVVGVVDTGIDVTHPAFRNEDGTTRIAWLITEGAPVGLHPELEEAYGCTDPDQSACAIFGQADIDQILATGELPNDARDSVGHGTHVASIAAGNGAPMVYGKPKFVGVAPGATIIAAAPTRGEGFYDADLLRATGFIFDRAADLGMPAAVNLSVGSDYGPHDGTGALESGLAAFVGDDKPGRVIVVAAGNSGSLYQVDGSGPVGVHTEVRSRDSSDTRVPIVAPNATGGQAFVWITFRPGDEVAVGFEGPDGETWVDLQDPGEQAGYDSEDGTTAAVVNNVVDGKTSLNPDTNSAIIAWDGSWARSSEFAVVLRGEGSASLWVVGQGKLATTGVFFERGMLQGTINVPASHPNLLAVGCTVNRLGWDPAEGPELLLTELGGSSDPKVDSSCYFSSAGPTPLGVPKPEISAPGAFVVSAMGLDADPRVSPGGMFDGPGCAPGESCYVVNDYFAVSSGSSMSAPHVTGAAALLLGVDPNLTQAKVTAILQAGARYPSGYVPADYQLGPGALSLVGALAAMADVEEELGTVETAASFWTLSSGYARPDATWPVWGTIELRQRTGQVVSGVDGSRLQVLTSDNGRVVVPLRKVRHGMFQFAVAGAEGSTGQVLHVAVRYDGVPIGITRELPIGYDPWSTGEPIGALGGGCGCRVIGLPSDDPRGSAALGLLALAWVAARLRSRHRPS